MQVRKAVKSKAKKQVAKIGKIFSRVHMRKERDSGDSPRMSSENRSAETQSAKVMHSYKCA